MADDRRESNGDGPDTDADCPDTDADGPDTDADRPLPEDVLDEAARLTRLARDVTDDAEARTYRSAREDLLAEHDYQSRVREDDDVLVLHPEEWLEDGTVRIENVADVDRGVEVPLSGPGEADDWEAVEAHNRSIAEAVAAEHGDPHGGTAHALADFAGNHYAKPLEELTAEELGEFRAEYFPRNAWPTDEQQARLRESVRLAFEAADARLPGSGASGDE